MQGVSVQFQRVALLEGAGAAGAMVIKPRIEADEDANGRAKVEEKLPVTTVELDPLWQRLRDREQQAQDVCPEKQSFAENLRVARAEPATLVTAEQERNAAAPAPQGRTASRLGARTRNRGRRLMEQKQEASSKAAGLVVNAAPVAEMPMDFALPSLTAASQTAMWPPAPVAHSRCRAPGATETDEEREQWSRDDMSERSDSDFDALCERWGWKE